MVPEAKEHGAQMVILNAEPTPFDDLADVVLREPIGQVLPSICAGVE
jgi:NAD-dependent deacetylase